MESTTLHRLYSNLQGGRCDFVYSGSFPDEHSPRLISIAEEMAGRSPADEKLGRKLAFVLVEAYQNIIRHRAPLPPEQEYGGRRSMFMLSSHDHHHVIATSNPLRAGEEQALRSILEKIDHNSDLKQLKELFLRGLQGATTSTRGGAGLGLIEMARRSSSGLQHAVLQQDGSMLFLLQLVIGERPGKGPALEDLNEMRRLIGPLDPLLLYKGRLQPGIQSVLLRAITTELSGDPALAERGAGAFLGAMEMVGKLDRTEAPPMMVLRRELGEHRLALALPMATTAAQELEKRGSELAQMDQRVLDKMYRRTLVERQTEGSDLTGLLDLARRSRTPLDMAILPQGDAMLLVLEMSI